MNLKIGTLDDFQTLKRMVYAFKAQSPYASLATDDTKMDNTIRDLLTGDPNEKVTIFALKNGAPVGVVSALKIQPIFSNDYLATEMIWWMDEEYRNSRLSIELMDAYEYWAHKVGCKLVQMSALETDIIDRLTNFYKRKGYTPTERGYIKEF